MVRHLTTRRLIKVQTIHSGLGAQKSQAVGRVQSIAEDVPIGLEVPDATPVAKHVKESQCSGIRHCMAGICGGNAHKQSAQQKEHGATGILVHGCHLAADGWEHIVWGNPPHELGRLPHAILLAWEEKAGVVIFGTGASQKDGLLESEFTLKFLWDHFAELAEFDAMKNVPIEEAEKMMRQIAVLDRETQNTDQEVRNGLKIMAEKNCGHAILVSSPTHLPRCLACACKVSGAEPDLFTNPIYASPSDTCYEGTSASDIVVVEPPHRGDRDKTLDEFKFNDLVKRMFRVSTDRKHEFFGRVTSLLEEFGV